jgi:hypothetical protein
MVSSQKELDGFSYYDFSRWSCISHATELPARVMTPTVPDP